MAITEKDFLDFAETLPDSDEINIRNSISRAYYSAYHLCNGFYCIDSSLKKSGGMHKQLIDSILNSNEPKDKQIGYLLKQLKLLRHSADYDLDENFTTENKVNSIRVAKKIFVHMEEAKEMVA